MITKVFYYLPNQWYYIIQYNDITNTTMNIFIVCTLKLMFSVQRQEHFTRLTGFRNSALVFKMFLSLDHLSCYMRPLSWNLNSWASSAEPLLYYRNEETKNWHIDAYRDSITSFFLFQIQPWYFPGLTSRISANYYPTWQNVNKLNAFSL